MKGNFFDSFLEKQGVSTKRNFWGEDEWARRVQLLEPRGLFQVGRLFLCTCKTRLTRLQSGCFKLASKNMTTLSFSTSSLTFLCLVLARCFYSLFRLLTVRNCGARCHVFPAHSPSLILGSPPSHYLELLNITPHLPFSADIFYHHLVDRDSRGCPQCPKYPVNL